MLASTSLGGASSMDLKGKGPSSSAEASMAALAAAAAAGEDDSGAAPPPHQRGEEDEKPAKLAAVGGASPVAVAASRRVAAAGGASSSSLAAAAAAARRGAGAIAAGPSCQADRCGADMSKEEKKYNRRHKVCEAHSKAAVVLVAGLRQRFCQQCSRFHELSEFDDDKRSCRQRLAGHNERRRKSSNDAHGSGGGRHAAEQNGRGPPGNHFQIR
ncbi:hypothetical protein U9M48_015307 [Paspalum notatum var. saurae]|uniref:SBP-type domain-containing protein n=1 Tax=Paspalum notatum var. saurae TaxID=547442 RepID=A0AAQ3T394_PASNO